jgi:hypothetical protein
MIFEKETIGTYTSRQTAAAASPAWVKIHARS